MCFRHFFMEKTAPLWLVNPPCRCVKKLTLQTSEKKTRLPKNLRPQAVNYEPFTYNSQVSINIHSQNTF